MAQLLVTLVGDDREGLVQALSRVVADHDGNWLESQMARLGGKFAGVVLVDVPDARREDFVTAARRGEGVEVDVVEADEPEVVSTPQHQVRLHVVGNDHPGIVREVTGVLAERGLSIDELSTYIRPAPMADTVLFHATLLARVPDGVRVAEVQQALEGLADELMVDVDFVEDLADE